MSGKGSGMVIQLKTAIGRVAAGSESRTAIVSEKPAVNITAAASPIARPIASRKAVVIPGRICRRMTFRVSQGVAPSE